MAKRIDTDKQRKNIDIERENELIKMIQQHAKIKKRKDNIVIVRYDKRGNTLNFVFIYLFDIVSALFTCCKRRSW
jgi:uncharacterized protein (UPF0371 family)